MNELEQDMKDLDDSIKFVFKEADKQGNLAKLMKKSGIKSKQVVKFRKIINSDHEFCSMSRIMLSKII